MIVRSRIIGKLIRIAAQRIFYRVENINNTNIDTNGEMRFVDNLFKYLKMEHSGKVIIFDVGANVGSYSKIVLEKSQNAHCDVELHLFEPVQSTFEVLEKVFGQHKNVFFNKKAVSERKEVTRIYYDVEKSGLASLYKRKLSAYSIDLNKSEEVETIRLDDYVERHEIDHIHCMKIDVEGHEMSAFRGMGKYFNGDFIDFVQFEYGGANLDSHTSLMELFEVFEEAGFRVAKMLPKGLEIRSYEPWMDDFQYANYVSISSRIIDQLT